MKNRLNRSKGGTITLLIVISLFAAIMALPLILVIGNSFKPLHELWVFPPRLLPEEPTLKNYRDMLNVMSGSLVPFSRYIFNTIMITVVGTVGNIVCSSMCAFQLAKMKFPGRNVTFKLIVMTLMFNATVTAIPNYMIMSKLHMIDTYWALIIPTFGSPLGLYLMKQFMEQAIPDSLIEAARIDGASMWTIYSRIVMPCVKPGWLTLILLSVQSLWNLGSTTYIFSDEKKTLAYALSQITSGGIARAGVGAAVSVVMMSVPILIFALTQSNIMETMSTSGMKE